MRQFFSSFNVAHTIFKLGCVHRRRHRLGRIKGGKYDKRSKWWGEVKDKAAAGESTCYLRWCVFCWGLSPSRLCSRRSRRISACQHAHACICTFLHVDTTLLNWSRSLNKQSKSLHNKQTTEEKYTHSTLSSSPAAIEQTGMVVLSWSPVIGQVVYSSTFFITLPRRWYQVR